MLTMSRAFLVDIVLAPMLDVAGAMPDAGHWPPGEQEPRPPPGRQLPVAPGSPQGSPGPSSKSGLAQVQVRTGGR